jgi:hypothetical protein
LEFPPELIGDVRKLIEIRNRITHQSGRFTPSKDSEDGRSTIRNKPLSATDMQHMLRHSQIAREFLEQFWLPGTRELTQFT